MFDAETELGESAEHLALALAAGGLQRMTARVLVALIFTDRPSMTMGELSELLQASAGTISDGIKALSTVGLVERVPAPGSRRGHYRLPASAWASLHSQQNAVLQAILAATEKGLAEAQPGGPAQHRLREMRDFYAFLMRELPQLIERWRIERKATTAP